MLNNGKYLRDGAQQTAPRKTRPPRSPFIFGAKALNGKGAQQPEAQSGRVAGDPAEPGKAFAKGFEGNPGGVCALANMAEVIKTLIHLAREQGHLTYDDINE